MSSNYTGNQNVKQAKKKQDKTNDTHTKKQKKIKQIPKMNETNDCDTSCDHHIEANQDRGRGKEMWFVSPFQTLNCLSLRSHGLSGNTV